MSKHLAADGKFAQRGRRSDGRESGQSLVEFALIVPILLMLFIAIADFGRVFAAIIALEASTRNAAETTANAYLATPPGPLNLPAPAGDPAYYGALHTASCGSLASPGSPSVPAGCGALSPPPSNGQSGLVHPRPRWVEVRTCYRFDPILNLPIFSLGGFWLQRTNEFTIPCYFALGNAECGDS